MGPRGKYQVGFCSVCGKDVCLRKTDQKVFRHPDQFTGRKVCKGTGEYPSMIVNPDGDVTNFVPISVRKEIVTVDVEKSRTYDPDWKVTRDSAHMVPSKDDVLLGKEFPVYTESGTVIGRARIGVDRVTILGSKWAQRTA